MYPNHPPAGRARLRAVSSRWLAGALLLVAAGAGAAESVVIAGEDDWAPYSYAAPATREPTGMAVEIVREAFAAVDVQAEIMVAPFARCMHLSKVGHVAGCFNATIVDDNRADYHWHQAPMFTEELAIFGRPGATTKPLGLDDLAGKRVGFTLGYTYPPEFRNDTRLVRISAKSDGVLLGLLLAGRVDYILANTGPLYLRMASDPTMRERVQKVGVISQDGFWLAFSKVHPQGQAMSRRFDAGLQKLRDNGRLEALIAGYRTRLGY